MKRLKVMAVVFAFALLAVVGLAADPVQLPMLFRNEGNDSIWELNSKIVDMFNKKYAGTYAIKVEFVPGVAIDIRTKLKMLAQSNNLPCVVSDLSAEPAFADQLMANGSLVDLMPYYAADTEWQKFILPSSLKYNTRPDGKMYTAPLSYASYVGIFYNKELFAKAGITQFPATWADFWAVCDKLKKAGITPLSLHTTETGWCPMLLGTSSFAETPEGMAFSEIYHPTSFNNAPFKKAMTIVKTAFQYATPDSVGGNYSNAANNFASGKTAMIPNGPWMIASLSDPQFAPAGFAAKVGYAPYPGNVMLSWLGKNYGDGAASSYPKAVQEGAVAWLKFNQSEDVLKLREIMIGDISVKIKLSDSDKASFNNVWKDYFNIAEKLKTGVYVYQSQYDPSTLNETIVNQLPQLIQGKLTVDQFADLCTKSATKWVADNK